MMLSPEPQRGQGLGVGLAETGAEPGREDDDLLCHDTTPGSHVGLTIAASLPIPRSGFPTVSTTPPRVFAARLAGLPVFDPQGDPVGKVRDVVVVLRSDVRQPRVVGLVVEVFGRRQVFAPMTRVTNIDAGQVITTGLLNMRRFEKRSAETLVVGQMLDRKVRVRSTGVEGVVFDVAMEQARTRDWVLSRVALSEGAKGFRRRAQTHVVEWDDVEGLAGAAGQPGRRAPRGGARRPASRRRGRT